MELSLLAVLVVICVIVTKFLLIPFALVQAFQLPHLLWLDSLQHWFALGVVLLAGAWVLGDR
ncbi:MAG: hypothetical protein NW220_16460 [Leptolyngbyaceae cyanobacterium bins.349]|nr:hypothetical protein [Leptolyngbyaceae cyanobacterium bins.349]